jgi:hypothetical protein
MKPGGNVFRIFQDDASDLKKIFIIYYGSMYDSFSRMTGGLLPPLKLYELLVMLQD